jgi:uncharacterized membrane protein YecN with MAPEG domain
VSEEGVPGLLTGLYAGVLALVYLALVYRVVARRQRYRVDIGDGGHADLARAIRTHGNFAEYVPFALLLLLIVELQGFGGYVIHLLGALLVLSRVAHIQGFGLHQGTSPGRAVGLLGTFVVILVAGILAVFGALGFRF